MSVEAYGSMRQPDSLYDCINELLLCIRYLISRRKLSTIRLSVMFLSN